MSEPNRILVKMLERLRAGLLDGPGINCRPHRSRQRVDFTQFAKFQADSPAEYLLDLLGPEKAAVVSATMSRPAKRHPPSPAPRPDDGQPPPSSDPPSDTGEPSVMQPVAPDDLETSEGDLATLQDALFHKLKILAEDARVYEQDTGVDVLHVGFPLLHIPPGAGGSTRRILAPLALIPVSMQMRLLPRPSVRLSCRSEQMDRVIPNPSLFAWLEQSHKPAPAELMEDDGSREPWDEIVALARWIAETFAIELPAIFNTPELPSSDWFDLVPAPRADDNIPAIVLSAVLGLFPVNNQALLRDMEAMIHDSSLTGPVRGFLDVAATLAEPEDGPKPETPSDGTAPAAGPSVDVVRLVTAADPCQARAVRLARTASGLVVHGPPGTGKSQTITNIIGDHLIRGQRVLFVSDKRTALDVVADRLAHLGLGSLVAVVHDPARDQRDFYRSVREQLESLAESKTSAKSEKDLARIDHELEEIRAELTEARRLLHGPSQGSEPAAVRAEPLAVGAGPSFHELVGKMLAFTPQGAAREVYDKAAVEGWLIARSDLDAQSKTLPELLARADSVQYGVNPWTDAVGASLDEFLARTGEEIRGSLQRCLERATQADTTADAAIPPFRADQPLADQIAARQQASELLIGLLDAPDRNVIDHWLSTSDDDWHHARRTLALAFPMEAIVRGGPLDAELWLQWGTKLADPASLAGQIRRLDHYCATAERWYAFLYVSRRIEARKILATYELPLGPESAKRLLAFLRGAQARQNLRSLLQALLGSSAGAAAPALADDTALLRSLGSHQRMLELLCLCTRDAPLSKMREGIASALQDPDKAEELLRGLAHSPRRAEAIEALQVELKNARLFRRRWLEQVHASLCEGQPIAETIQSLSAALPSCETVLRVRDGVSQLPDGLRGAVSALLQANVPAEVSLATLERIGCEQAIRAQFVAHPQLARLDGERLTQGIQRYRQLRQEKHKAVCAAVLHRWTELQKERLLATTRTRLNSDGADVRRRLLLQGDRALRLRKVIEVGRAIAGGDPLFDLRPVWMASPETVAQIFPRLALFDAIVFDEASQCRLEHALPVLTRGKRVVVAGDSKQLPPTRFFETAVIASEADEAETGQEWFEVQQGDVEDLLTASLNLQIEQSYLDVHYRSRNADLIAFSNYYFYGSRLQPIPVHPKNRLRSSPIELIPSGGVYDKRRNIVEAQAVSRLVRDLLNRTKPPSIGVACFNTEQRDQILDSLDELAEDDERFAERLAQARSRKGKASNESLFVKNLENVQGDERDHIIISTTYGPDPNGRFYRRFGPLGRAGGGRRLNVLVTRARESVHLVTSIPPSVYQSLPPVPQGQSPNGAWLLFAYLAFARNLQDQYAANSERESRDGAPVATAEGAPATVQIRPSESGSLFAEGVARRLAEEQQLPSQVHWGNDAFCVDVALSAGRSPENATIGLLCDLNRYPRADDAIEWEIFRTDVLEGAGWQLQRIWSPQFYRDAMSVTQKVAESVKQVGVIGHGG